MRFADENNGDNGWKKLSLSNGIILTTQILVSILAVLTWLASWLLCSAPNSIQ
jgi:hypothetical protein